MTVASFPASPAKDDLSDLRRKLEQLAHQGRLDELIELVLSLLEQARDSNTSLTLRLGNALRALYGRKSAKVSVEQLSLMFAELGQDVPAGAQQMLEDSAGDAQVPQPQEPPKPPRGRGGRSPLPPHLPRQEEIVAVPEPQRHCSLCGGDKKGIGYVSTPVLELVPARLVVIEEKREKMVCPRCAEEGVVTAPSEKVMDRGRPGPGLLAKLLVSKVQDGMPLYRQSQEYEREGVWLSTSTLGDWYAFGLDVLKPVAEYISGRVVSSDYIHADDTGLPVLDRDHPKGAKRGHMWAFVGGGLVAFHYTPDWKSTRPAAFLRNFSGYLHGDGYAGYQAMLHDGDRGDAIVPEERRLGCAMHIRAKFESAAKLKDMRASVALLYFQKLYRIEASCKSEGLSPEERKARRDELSLPVVDELYEWIRDVHAKLPPTGALYTATRYALNQEAAWRRCFLDGRFEIDNGEAERQLRRVALGRKNYLFAGSDKGAERLAVAYTVFGSCHMHGVNPWAWATDVIRKLQRGWPLSRLDELVPDAWGKEHPDQVRPHRPR